MARRQQDDALFTFGHSLSTFDRHITKIIAKGWIKDVYVGVYQGDARRVAELAHEWRSVRAARSRPAINIRVYDVAEAPVWRD